MLKKTDLNKPSVLFVCTANRFRSAIAESEFCKLLRERGIEKDWIVGSAGTWAEEGLLPVPSADWMKENLGLDLSAHRSRSINRELITHHQLVLVMEKNQKEALRFEFAKESHKVFMLTEICNGSFVDIPDPIFGPEEMRLNVAREIIQLIKNGFEAICMRASSVEKTSDNS